jgi:stage II sporulation protein D
VIRKSFAFLLLLFLSGHFCAAQEIRIGVLGIFHPQRLGLEASRAQALVVALDGDSFVLGQGSPNARAKIGTAGDELAVTIHGREIRARELRAAGRMGDARFLLSVPGKVSRHYRGSLTITVKNGELTPVVTMDLETAVASVLQAETGPQTPLEALKAQAIVTRSYFVAGKGRHESYDFCDLAHCQVLRDPPAPASIAAKATQATRGLVLTYQGQAFAAMFTRSCGGRTRTPAELGLPINGYPYFSVVCNYCQVHPFCWTRKLSSEDAAILQAKSEAGRLTLDRRLGWNAVPSNNFTSRVEGEQVLLEGKGQGHGIGLCQLGAKAMAARGADFRAILRHYFPNTRIVSLLRQAYP